MVVVCVFGCERQHTETSEVDHPVDGDRLMDVMSRSLTFRDVAAKDVRDAARFFGADQFRIEQLPLMVGVRESSEEAVAIWSFFFLNAYPLIGTLTDDTARVGFLNPYLDIIALSSWEDGKVTALTVQRGEALMEQLIASLTHPRYMTTNLERSLGDRMGIVAREVRQTFGEIPRNQEPGSQDVAELESVQTRIALEAEYLKIFTRSSGHMELLASTLNAVLHRNVSSIENLLGKKLDEGGRAHFFSIADAYAGGRYELAHVIWSTDGLGVAIPFLAEKSSPALSIVLPMVPNKEGKIELKELQFLSLNETD